MTSDLSPNTHAILLLTAPLIVGRGSSNSDLLTSGEYKRLAVRLREAKREPADLVTGDPSEILAICEPVIDKERLRRLLGRGFQLSQAVERWQSRAIWVISRADALYPRRLKERLRGNAPPVLYGCGDRSLLEEGGLAVVGSRNVDDALTDYALRIGQSVARIGKSVVSGGARGVDQAAMRGALEASGQSLGILADSLERQAVNREHRNMLLDGRLTLVSPFDPNAGFNTGNAMQRNKVIYALSDAALVVNSDVQKGGTWTGAVEQIEKLKLVPIYVRSTGEFSAGLDALRKKGALDWPRMENDEALETLLNAPLAVSAQKEFVPMEEEAGRVAETAPPVAPETGSPITEELATSVELVVRENVADATATPAEVLYACVKELIGKIASAPIAEADVSQILEVNSQQLKLWLNRLVTEDFPGEAGKAREICP